MNIISIQASRGKENVSVQLTVPDGLELKEIIQTSLTSSGVIGKYFCYCEYNGIPGVFKYDITEEGRFKNDLQLYELGISPQILFPNADDIYQSTYNYAIYQRIQNYSEFVKSTTKEQRNKLVNGYFQRLIYICEILYKNGFIIIDPNINNFGFDEGVLLFFDGIIKYSDWFPHDVRTDIGGPKCAAGLAMSILRRSVFGIPTHPLYPASHRPRRLVASVAPEPASLDVAPTPSVDEGYSGKSLLRGLRDLYRSKVQGISDETTTAVTDSRVGGNKEGGGGRRRRRRPSKGRRTKKRRSSKRKRKSSKRKRRYRTRKRM